MYIINLRPIFNLDRILWHDKLVNLVSAVGREEEKTALEYSRSSIKKKNFKDDSKVCNLEKWKINWQNMDIGETAIYRGNWCHF